MILALSVLAICFSVGAIVFAWREHKRYVSELRELRARAEFAERNLRHLGDLANEVAHEIKNPLTAMLCSAETLILLLGDSLDEMNRKSLFYIKEYGDHLLRLVSDFLDLSQAETGRLVVNKKGVNLKSVLSSVSGLLQAQAHHRKVTLIVSLEEEGLEINFDSKHVKQILLNLIHNAIKFTPPGGEVRIQAMREFPSSRVRLAVGDTGVGIPEDRIDTIFEPYWTHGAGEQYEGSDLGTGLGLSLCKVLAEANGSTLEVESTRGVGTTFWFYAEMYEPENHRMKSGAIDLTEGKDEPLAGQKFLFVEEDPRVADTISDLVEAWGGMADMVSSAIEAVDALSAEDYDAVVVDHSEDGLYPHEVVELLQEHPASSDTTLIMTTTEDYEEELVPDSEVRTISKPYSGSSLLKSLLRTGKFTVSH